jgi:hypothetical protein
MKIERIAMRSGAMKNSAYVFASESSFNANENVIIMMTDSTPRTRCSGQRTSTSCRNPPAAIVHRNTIGSADRPRNAATSAAG